MNNETKLFISKIKTPEKNQNLAHEGLVILGFYKIMVKNSSEHERT